MPHNTWRVYLALASGVLALLTAVVGATFEADWRYELASTATGTSDPMYNDSSYSDPSYTGSDPSYSDPAHSDPSYHNDPAYNDPSGSDSSNTSADATTGTADPYVDSTVTDTTQALDSTGTHVDPYQDTQPADTTTYTDPSQTSTATDVQDTTATNQAPDTTADVSVPVDSHGTCPLDRSIYPLLVDFTNGGTATLARLTVRADGTVSEAQRSYPATLRPGTYDIVVASRDPDPVIRNPEEYLESWWLDVYDRQGTRMVHSGPSRDLKAGETRVVEQMARSVVFPNESYRIVVRSAAYPSKQPHAVAPLCVAFRLAAPLSPSSGATDQSAPPLTSVDSQQPHTEPVDTGTYGQGTHTVRQDPSQLPHTDRSAVLPSTDSTDPTRNGYVTRIKVEPVRGSTTRHIATIPAAPHDVGVQSAMRTVEVPRDVLVFRRALVAQSGTTTVPFSALAAGAQREREDLVQKSLRIVQTVSTTTTHTDPINLERTTDESEDVGSTRGEEATRAVQVRRLIERDGLHSVRDTDGDGISDYDETHIYNTDPYQPFTSGSVFTDGERVLLGYDPRATSTKPVIAESPRTRGTTTPHLFSVERVALVPVSESEQSPVSSRGSLRAQSTGATGVRIEGRAKPYSFVTLYVYSTPIVVTVRADRTGRFAYTLDRTLEDGTHELYVASTDGSGRILAKSSAVPFTKTAQAIEFLPQAEVSTLSDPVGTSAQNMLIFGMLILLLGAVGMIVWFGRHTVTNRSSSPDDSVSA